MITFPSTLPFQQLGYNAINYYQNIAFRIQPGCFIVNCYQQLTLVRSIPGSASGVPGSAVLQFELELMSLQKGVPDGYLFVWLEDSPAELFKALDMDNNEKVPVEEVWCYNNLDEIQ